MHVSEVVTCRVVRVGYAVRCRAQKDLDWQKLPHADETMAGKHRRLCKSRYASISSYLSESPMMKDEYNDIPLPVDEATLERLQTAGAWHAVGRVRTGPGHASHTVRVSGGAVRQRWPCHRRVEAAVPARCALVHA